MTDENPTATGVPEPAAPKSPKKPKADATPAEVEAYRESLRIYNKAAKQRSRKRYTEKANVNNATWDSTFEITKNSARDLLEARGIKNQHVLGLLVKLGEAAARHHKIPINSYLYTHGLRAALKSREAGVEQSEPDVKDEVVVGEIIHNRDLNALWDYSLHAELDVTYEQFKETRYSAKTDAFFLGKELLSRDFSTCHREWINDFYPRIKPDLLKPNYTQAELKDWWSEQLANQPKEYLQLASRSSFKSSTAVVFLISIILQAPDVRCLLVSEVSKLSKDFIKSLRFFFESRDSRFAQYFPEHQITPGDSSILTFEDPMAHLGLPQPTAHAVGMDSSAQGLRANIVLVDDPIGVLTVANEEQRKISLEKYDMLKNVRERSGLVFLVGTPYHPQDLFKSVLDRNERTIDGSFRSRIDPAFKIKEHAVNKDLPHLLPEDVELLFEKQIPFEELMRSCKANRRFFESQQLCRFVELEETIKLNFDRALLTKAIVPYRELPEGVNYLVVDSAFSTSNRADNSVCAVVRLATNPQGLKSLYVIDVEAGRFRTSELAAIIVRLWRQHGAKTCIIEKIAAWDLVEQEVSRTALKYGVSIHIFWTPIDTTKGAKLRRLKNLEGIIYSGQLMFASGLYTESLFIELERLGGAVIIGGRKRDDQADALSLSQKVLLPSTTHQLPADIDATKKLQEEQYRQLVAKEQYDKYFGGGVPLQRKELESPEVAEPEQPRTNRFTILPPGMRS